FSYTSLIDACARQGELQKGRALLGEMRQKRIVPNELSYTSLLQACSKSGEDSLRQELLEEMQELKTAPKQAPRVVDGKRSQPMPFDVSKEHSKRLLQRPGQPSQSPSGTTRDPWEDPPRAARGKRSAGWR
ncbi:unnamed protein product, partial [Polarella glacialis]